MYVLINWTYKSINYYEVLVLLVTTNVSKS